MQGMLNRAGIRCSVEDKHSFKSLHPADNTRADLTVRGFGNIRADCNSMFVKVLYFLVGGRSIHALE
jgi:hypothetical protein